MPSRASLIWSSRKFTIIVKKWFASGKNSGKKTVWTLGCDVPDEIIIAAGMLPVRLSGKYENQPNADKYLENSFGPDWRAMFEKIMCGESKGLYDFITFPSRRIC